MKYQTLLTNIKAELLNKIRCGLFWENILLDMVACDFATHRGKDRYQTIRSYEDEVLKRIDSWDVRLVGKLRDLFPYAFPPSLRKGELVCYMADNANADWMVEKVTPAALGG